MSSFFKKRNIRKYVIEACLGILGSALVFTEWIIFGDLGTSLFSIFNGKGTIQDYIVSVSGIGILILLGVIVVILARTFGQKSEIDKVKEELPKIASPFLDNWDEVKLFLNMRNEIVRKAPEHSNVLLKEIGEVFLQRTIDLNSQYQKWYEPNIENWSGKKSRSYTRTDDRCETSEGHYLPFFSSRRRYHIFE